jgi:hypothetical protein
MAQSAVKEPKVRARGIVRVTLPAKVAYSPDALKESIASVMERLGCPRCFSGADCLFQAEREFVLDATGGPVPQPTAGAAQSGGMLTAGLASDVRYDINRVYRAIDKVIDLIGPHPCISGFDIFFKDVLDTVVVDKELKGQAFDQRF